MGTQHLTQGSMQQVGRRVVALGSTASLDVDGSMQRGIDVAGELGSDVYGQVVLAFGVGHLNDLVTQGEGAAVTHLATHLGIER